MLLVLTSAIWLVLVATCIALCRSAANAEQRHVIRPIYQSHVRHSAPRSLPGRSRRGARNVLLRHP